MGDALSFSTETGNFKREKSIKHYSSSHKILLVGEGDFSFSVCLARAFGSANNMISTSYDSINQLLVKHCTANNHLEELKTLGCTLLHEIDVKDMHQHNFLKAKRFDRIIFNFPHAGLDGWNRETHHSNILRHKELLLKFFNSARNLLITNGEIHVSHRNDNPYNKWDIVGLAKNCGLIMKEAVKFNIYDYRGYENKKGCGINSNKTFPLGYDAYTFKFSLNNEWKDNEGSSNVSIQDLSMKVSNWMI